MTLQEISLLVPQRPRHFRLIFSFFNDIICVIVQSANNIGPKHAVVEDPRDFFVYSIRIFFLLYYIYILFVAFPMGFSCVVWGKIIFKAWIYSISFALASTLFQQSSLVHAILLFNSPRFDAHRKKIYISSHIYSKSFSETSLSFHIIRNFPFLPHSAVQHAEASRNSQLLSDLMKDENNQDGNGWWKKEEKWKIELTHNKGERGKGREVDWNESHLQCAREWIEWNFFRSVQLSQL